MSAVQFFLPYQTATYNGIAQPGAKLYFYTTGTTTPLTIYSNSGLSVARANPVVANGAGQFPAFYLDNTKSYRLVIKDKNDASLGVDIDPYVPGTIPDASALTPYTDSATASAAAAALDAANALVAYNSIASTANATAHAATRTALALLGSSVGPVYLRESGREGTFVWSSSNLSTYVTADTAQGIYVAPASATTGASGAWVRKYDGPVKPDWFGIVRGENAGANATANNTAFTAMFATLLALAPSVSGSKSLADVDLGYGIIEVSSPITPSATCRMFGRGIGHWVINVGTYAGTVIRPYACTAFSLAQTRSSLSDVAIQGNMAVGTVESEQHGVSITQTAFLTRVKVRSMPGDGFNIDGQTGAGHLPDGSSLTDCEAWSCRDGLSIGVTGGNGDANVIRVSGGFYQSNRRWGVNDQGFLGNMHTAWEGAGNGTQARNDGVDIAATVVFYGIAQGGSVNGLYGCIAGQEVGAATNAPSGSGVDNTWWYYKGTASGATSGRPVWVSGMLVRSGGILYTNNVNAPHVFQGCYAESDQGFAQTVHPTHIYGGTLAKYVWKGGSGVAEFVDTNGAKNLSGPLLIGTSGGPYTGTDEIISAAMAEVSSTKTMLKATSSVGAPSSWRLKFAGNTTGDMLFDYANQSTQTVFQMLGPNTADQAGTGAARPYGFRPTILLVPNNSTSQNDNARRLMIDTAAPSTGAHAIGEYCFNRTSDGTQPLGWRNLAQGTPGTQQAFYSGYGTNPIGYVTGAGNTVTQATDKTTGVTINKLCGQITMSAAALGASTSVGFTVTNSQIAATDIVIVNIGSGATANSYTASVDAVAAGSCHVHVRNVSAGSLSEALVLNFAVIKAVAA